MSDEELNEYLARVEPVQIRENTITDADALRKEVAVIRKRGYAEPGQICGRRRRYRRSDRVLSRPYRRCLGRSHSPAAIHLRASEEVYRDYVGRRPGDFRKVGFSKGER
ncbi:IclR family transcriptional regulator domain-containing protein [Rhizobium mayense]|uniref:IclR family transcriptional regulator domain-containing protein n=1 Tax=Rhizobium mayense TaxID=1312184 RepID=UPI003D80A631